MKAIQFRASGVPSGCAIALESLRVLAPLGRIVNFGNASAAPSNALCASTCGTALAPNQARRAPDLTRVREDGYSTENK